MATKDFNTPALVALRKAKGNVPQDVKDSLADRFSRSTEGRAFASFVAKRLEATELNVYDKPEEAGKKEARIVFETDVQEDMCNPARNMHGGCTAFLIDLCSSFSLSLLATQVAPDKVLHVSLVINTIYHAPAPLGCRLKIVNTTVALGSRVMTARTEIYDITNSRLVASGVHLKMPPSQPKL